MTHAGTAWFAGELRRKAGSWRVQGDHRIEGCGGLPARGRAQRGGIQMVNRRQFVAGTAGLSAMALLTGSGLAQQKKPVVWWTGFADPEQKAIFENDIIN